MKSTPLAPFGAPARVSVTKVVRTQYRLEWEYDGSGWATPSETGEDWDRVPERKRRVRFVTSRASAYRMAAMRLIFARRDKLATGVNAQGYPSGCSACDDIPPQKYDGYDEPVGCRYHGGNGFDEIVARLARWLRWRDSVVARGEAFRAKSRGWFRRTAA